jgi:predicted transcriptional regulator
MANESSPLNDIAAESTMHPWSQSSLRRPARVLHFESETGSFRHMTDKQAVIDALGRLPENASLDEIAEELRIMAAIRRGGADVAAGRTKTHQEAKELVESWASAWTSK